MFFIIGFGMRADIWRPQLEFFGSRFDVAWMENRGFGESESGSEKFPSIKTFARDSIRVLDALKWHSGVHLVGVSMGGMIAQELALMVPERFKSMSLIASTPGGHVFEKIPPAPGIARFFASLLLPNRYGAKFLAEILYTREFLESTNQSAIRARLKLQMSRKKSSLATARQLIAVLRFNAVKRIKNLKLPVLIIVPEQDILVAPRHSRRLQQQIQESELIVIDDAGHGVIYQSAKDVNEALERHITKAE